MRICVPRFGWGHRRVSPFFSTRREGGVLRFCQLLMAKQPTPQFKFKSTPQRQVV